MALVEPDGGDVAVATLSPKETPAADAGYAEHDMADVAMHLRDQ